MKGVQLMKCPNHEQLSAYIDEELTRSEMQIIGEHLKDCLSCRIEVDRLEKLVAKIRVLSREKLSIPAPILLITPKKRFNWRTAIAILLLAISSAVIIGYSHENMALHQQEKNHKEIEYYYKDHYNYTRNQNNIYFSLVSWE